MVAKSLRAMVVSRFIKNESLGDSKSTKTMESEAPVCASPSKVSWPPARYSSIGLWLVTEGKVCEKGYRNLEELKTSFEQAWDNMT